MYIPRYLAITLNSHCDHNCTYCFAANLTGNEEMALDTYFDIFHLLQKFNQYQEKDYYKGVVGIQWVFKEPLASYPILKQALETMPQRNIPQTLFSTGDLLTAEIAQFLIDHHILLRLSLNNTTFTNRQQFLMRVLDQHGLLSVVYNLDEFNYSQAATNIYIILQQISSPLLISICSQKFDSQEFAALLKQKMHISQLNRLVLTPYDPNECDIPIVINTKGDCYIFTYTYFKLKGAPNGFFVGNVKDFQFQKYDSIMTPFYLKHKANKIKMQSVAEDCRQCIFYQSCSPPNATIMKFGSLSVCSIFRATETLRKEIANVIT